MLEFVLLRSGRLIFYPQTTREFIVIDNVVNINKAEERLTQLLSSVSVSIDQNDDGV
jgi:hypothetical protein